MNTTLNKIRAHRPCACGWTKLLRYLGKTQADAAPLPIDAVLDSNGINDALWALRTVDGHDREIRLYAVFCARQVQHLLEDRGSLDALDVAERYANGEASQAELSAAWDAAGGAARDAAWAAGGAARDAAWAAWDAAGDAAGDAAWGAAWDAAWAAGGAARDAAWAAGGAARDAQSDELRRLCRLVAEGRAAEYGA